MLKTSIFFTVLVCAWHQVCVLAKLIIVNEQDCTYRLEDDGLVLEGVPIRFLRNGTWEDGACAGVKAVRDGWELQFGDLAKIYVENYELGPGLDYAVLTFHYLQEVVTGAPGELLVTTFPAFSGSERLDGVLAWQGSFVQPQRRNEGCTSGTQGGPCVLFEEANPGHGVAIVFSAMDHFLETSRSTTLHDGQKVAWAGSTSGKIKRIPKNYKHSFIVFRGKDGVSDTVYQWGQALQRHYQTKRVSDVTIETLGYQTDNGAQYCFGCGNKCDQVLLEELAYLERINVPVRYLSYQNAWWHTSGTAPWCVSDWDWVPSKVPMGVPEFHKRANMPFQLYAPYFCNETKYARNFTFLTSNPSLPTCDGFLFKDVAPEDSLAFYTWFFKLGITYGMTSYEADFVNQNLNCIDRFLEEIGAAEGFLDGMTQAAENLNLSVQWCYASPSALLQSLKYPVVTNFRGSFDYYYGGSWDIGLSSILMWALNISPSKDTFWTTDNGDKALTLGGCDKKRGCPPDHGDVGCELHTILAIMTTGPVGFSDAINHTNAERIRATCRDDGVLLRPDKPLTTMDNHFRKPYHLLQTYSGGSLPTYYILAHHIGQQDLFVGLDELWPRVSTALYPKWAVRIRGMDKGCFVDGSKASDGCITQFITSESTKIHIPRTNSSDPFASRLVTVFPVCSDSPWIFLGEVSKYVSHATARFVEVVCAGGIQVTATGKPGEKVSASFVNPRGKVVVATFRIPPSGFVTTDTTKLSLSQHFMQKD